MKNLKKFLGFAVVLIAVMVAFCSVSFAATVGDVLTNPETGWQRYESENPNFLLVGNWQNVEASSASAGLVKCSFTSCSVNFKFKGTKLRIISAQNTNNSSVVTVNVDGIPLNYNCKNNTLIRSLLIYEKVNLTDTEHTVTITKNDTDAFNFDAIDIDTNGYLVDYLKATDENAKVNLSWNTIVGATSYNIKRATTPGGPYTTIDTSASNTYTDTKVSNGTTYYYVVSAVTAIGESTNSNEVSATPTAPVVTGNRGILELTMTNGNVKEYDLSATELQSFLTWYDGRANGGDKAYYIFTKKNNIKPFLSRKEYIAFDKISSFEVKEYTE